MWQAPNQRVRAIASAKKREKERNRRPIHIKRVQAELKVVGTINTTPHITQARVLLNDLSPKGLGLFAANPIMVGQQIALTIEEPKRFYIRGRVIWCQEHDADSHVLSPTPYSYRIGIEFVFESREEEQQVAAYCDEIAKNHLFTLKAA